MGLAEPSKERRSDAAGSSPVENRGTSAGSTLMKMEGETNEEHHGSNK
ncbi:hypothetical protein ACP70R_005528 [Stipagrostis hirtigluma subsp. patula]